MKRAKLIDRLKLLAERRQALMIAAGRAREDWGTNEHGRRYAEQELEVAAIGYAIVAIRYLGGAKE